MRYIEEEIDSFIKILKSVDSPPKSNKVSGKYCHEFYFLDISTKANKKKNYSKTSYTSTE